MNQFPNHNTGWVQPPQPLQVPKKEIPIHPNEAVWIITCSAMVALLYAICFNGADRSPQLSFPIFSLSTFGILTLLLQKLGCYRNKKAVVTLIPITLLSLMNGIFDLNLFSYTNVLAMCVLFGIYVISATQSRSVALLSATMLKYITKTILGNWLIFTKVFGKLSNQQKNQTKDTMLKKVLLGVLISLPILAILVALLSSADQVFHRFFRDFFDGIFKLDFTKISFLITFALIWIYAIGYVVQAKINHDQGLSPVVMKNVQVDIVVGATVLILINLLFFVFSAIQVAFLFRGGFMTLPEGMVYSEYAREGFFQLLLVTIINFSVIITFVSLLKGSMTSGLLRVLLLLLCLFTSVLIASSFYRMYLYIDVYGYTVLRLCVVTFLVMEVLLIAVTMVTLLHSNFAFGKWFVSICFLFYLIVNVTGTDYVATRLNIDRYFQGKQETLDVTFTRTDGLYLIEEFRQNGHDIPLRQYYDYYYDPGEEVRIGVELDLVMFQEWQNWSYFKRRGFQP